MSTVENRADQTTATGASAETLGVPFAVRLADQIPKQRYYDRDFYDMEAELLWSRVWQMACRLEEIPEPGDFAEYRILDQSVLVVRTDDGGVTAFQNTCRHRGVRLAEGQGNCASGLTCPFHGWCYSADGTNVAVTQRTTFTEHNLVPDQLDLTPVQCDTWGGCAWINLDPTAPPLRESLEPVASILDGWKVESLRTEWWAACRLPVNWKLAQEAFVEQYHVIETHPQLVIPGRYAARPDMDPRDYVAADLAYLRQMSAGMDGMFHADDLAVAEALSATIDLPDDPREAAAAWHRGLNEEVVRTRRALGHDVPDLQDLEDRGLAEPMGYCFPHYFVLPMYGSASSYRFRPLGPEETLMEIWSMTRYPEGTERPRPTPPEVWDCTDDRWPPIPAQDFSNLPMQQLGLHNRGFEFMRLSEKAEGHISNFQRMIDGYLAGLPHDRLLPALSAVNVNPLTRPIVEIDL